MYYPNNKDKDDPSDINFDSNQLFGHSFEQLNNLHDNNNPFLNFDSSSHSLPPSHHFDTSFIHSQHDVTTPTSGLGHQDFMLSQADDYNMNFYHFDNHNNNNHHSSNTNAGGIDPANFYMDDSQQQAILLSDPSFLRQQQLLHEQQQKANKIEQQQHQPMRSGLSAMFNTNDPQQQQQSTSKESSSSPQMEPINLITSQQQRKDIINSQNRRTSTQSTKNAKPIPISSSLPSNTSSESSGIDHQRRFNELQARFRINYQKKPTKSFKETDTTGTSLNSEKLSSSLTETTNNRRKSSLDPTAKPLLRMNSGKIKVVGGNSINKSPTVSIPTNTTPTNASSAMTTPSSFPSRTMPIQIQRVQRANASQPFDLEQRQKRLDDQLIKVDFNDITVSELKEMLRQRGKPATGKKALLVQRLQEEKDMILIARANGISISNRYLIQQQQQPMLEVNHSPVMHSPVMDHAVSLPDTMYLSSSPNTAAIGSLNRSIADMHIGSPPITSQQSRRFAPYATSPRTATSPQQTAAPSFFSSSVPTGSLDMMMMQQHMQEQQQQSSKPEEPQRVMRGFNFKKSYAPFASSALATPDRDDDHNPFDDVKREEYNATVSTHDHPQENAIDSPRDMEWSDPALDFMLQQHGIQEEYNDKSAEELMAFLQSQGLYHQPGDHFPVDELNFNLNGGPDPSSVMFDQFDNNTTKGNHHPSNY